MNKWKQSKKPYKLRNPQKYLGDLNQLKYKSSWEEEAFKICDNNPYVLEWGYEIIEIMYAVPSNGKMMLKKYLPDLYVVVQTESGDVERRLIEIKPLKQTKRSKSRNPRIKLQEDHVHMINRLKWDAAENWCIGRGIKFSVVTERELFGKQPKN